jgi:hypothetical protein
MIGGSKKIGDKKLKVSQQNRVEVRGSGRPSTGNGNKTVNPANIDWSKTSDSDFLNDRITLKK